MTEQALCKGMEKAVRREKQQPWSGTAEALLTWELVETVESSLRGSQSMCNGRWYRTAQKNRFGREVCTLSSSI